MIRTEFNPGDYVLNTDGLGDQTLWLVTPNRDVMPVLRKCDLPESALHLWDVILEAVGAV